MILRNAPLLCRAANGLSGLCRPQRSWGSCHVLRRVMSLRMRIVLCMLICIAGRAQPWDVMNAIEHHAPVRVDQHTRQERSAKTRRFLLRRIWGWPSRNTLETGSASRTRKRSATWRCLLRSRCLLRYFQLALLQMHAPSLASSRSVYMRVGDVK